MHTRIYVRILPNKTQAHRHTCEGKVALKMRQACSGKMIILVFVVGTENKNLVLEFLGNEEYV